MALGVLTASLLSGNALTALADQDVNHGPGVSQAPEVSQEAPGVSGDTTQNGPGIIVEPGSGTGGQESSQSETASPETETPAPEAGTEGQASGETAGQAQEVPPEESTQVPSNQAFLQVQLLRPDMTWTDPIRDDTTIYPGEGGFISMSIYANNLPGDVLYRTYSAPRGWSNWAMNGGHTSWAADCPIEAIQIRLNGVFGNSFDVYYCATLSDGTVCDWSKNGGTNGAMACGRYITGLRFSLWGKGTEGAVYKMDAPLVSAAPDGIQFVNGTPVFSNGTGDLFTGWVWNDRDRYYVVDNAIVTGWQYIDGYKYYFEADGKLVQDLEPYLNAQGPFMLKINKQMNCTTVYIQDGTNGFIIPYKTFLCSTGDDTPLTPH